MKETKQRNKNLTIPNAISVARIILIPFIAYYFLEDKIFISVVLICTSGLSDMFDGLIARKFNQVTELGKMLDPLADKLTQGIVAICLTIKYPHIRVLLLVFIGKELLMLIFAIVLLKAKKRPCAAQWYGKVSTVLFYFSVAIIVAMSAFNVETGLFDTVSFVLLFITAVSMLYALYRYAKIFFETIKSDDEKYSFDLPDEIRAKRDVAPKREKKS